MCRTNGLLKLARNLNHIQLRDRHLSCAPRRSPSPPGNAQAEECAERPREGDTLRITHGSICLCQAAMASLQYVDCRFDNKHFNHGAEDGSWRRGLRL